VGQRCSGSRRRESWTYRLEEVLKGGFSLEVSGRTGSGRRLFVLSLLPRLLGEGKTAIYIDYSGTFWRLSRSNPGLGERVVFTSPGDPGEVVRILSGSYDLAVLDSIPRVFSRFGGSYREKWGVTAAILLAGLQMAGRGGGFIAINHSSGGRSFGENVFACYFTHRVVLEGEGRAPRAKLIYPFEADLSHAHF
jgi:hypothetical protein